MYCYLFYDSQCIIIITHLYSALRSEDTEVLAAGGLSKCEQMGFQVALECANALAQSNVSW